MSQIEENNPNSRGKQFTSEYQPENEKWTESESLKFINDLIAWIKEKDDNIFVDDFIFLSCDESKYAGNIYAKLPNYLASKFDSCSTLYARAIQMQKAKLVKYGVMDKLNAHMTKFTLINNHGWKEKTDITTNDDNLTHVVTYKLPDNGRTED